MPFRIVEETPEEEIQQPKAKFRIVEETPQEGFDFPGAAKKVVTSSILGSLGLGRGGPDLDQMLKFKAPEKTEEELQKEKEERAKQFKFFGYTPEAETIEKIRHPVGVSMKGLAKGILGTPGDLVKFAQGLVGVEDGVKGIPTSDQVGKVFENLASEEFNPENLGEEFAERGFEFLGSIIGLGGPLKGSTAAKTIGRNILGAFAPAGVSLFTEKMEMPGWAQAAATIGTSFLAHRLTGTGLNSMKNKLYSSANESAKGATVNAKNLTSNAEKMIRDLKVGGIEASDKEAIRKLRDALKETKNGKIGVDDLMSLKRKLNEARGTLFSKDLGRSGVKSARRKLDQVAGLFDNTIKEYKNPEFQKIYKQANQLHGGMAETQRIYDFLKTNFKESGISAFLLKTVLPKFLTKGSQVTGVAQTGQFIKALSKYPGYRKAYFDVLKNASKEEIRGTAAAIKRLEKKTEELDSDKQYRILEE